MQIIFGANMFSTGLQIGHHVVTGLSWSFEWSGRGYLPCHYKGDVFMIT
jgi:hypothetical protein